MVQVVTKFKWTSGGDTPALAVLRNMPSVQERCTNTKNSYSGFKYIAHIPYIIQFEVQYKFQ